MLPEDGRLLAAATKRNYATVHEALATIPDQHVALFDQRM